MYGTRDAQQRVVATRVIIQRQSTPVSIQLFQGRVQSVNTGKPSFMVQPDFGGPAIEVLVSSSTRYEQSLSPGQQPPGATRLFSDVKVGGQVQVNGQRLSGTQAQATLVVLFEVAKVSSVGRAVFVDLAQNAVILGQSPFQISSSTQFSGGYSSSNDIQVGDIVNVTFNPGSSGQAAALSIAFQGRPTNTPGQTQPGGTQPGGTRPAGTQPGGTQPGGTQPGGTQPAPRLENVSVLAQTTQPGTGTTFSFVSQVQSINRQTGVLTMAGMYMQVPPGTVLVDETGRQMSLQALQERILKGETVFLRVEAEQRGGSLQVTKAGAVEGQSGDIPTGQTGPLTLKSATFDATPSPIPMANAVNVPTTATLTIQFDQKVSSGILSNSEIIFLPRPDGLSASVQNGNLVIALKLKANTAYTALLDLNPINQTITGAFTTGASLPNGAVSGKVKLPTVASVPLPANAPANLLTGLKFQVGDAFVLLTTQDPAKLRNATMDQVIAATVGASPMNFGTGDTADYTIRAVPPGKYYVGALVNLRLVQQNGSPPTPNVQQFLQGINFDLASPYSKTSGSDTADQVDVGTAAVTGTDIQASFLSPITVAEVTPKEGAVSVPLETTVSVRFSGEPAHDARGIAVNLQITPTPLSGPIQPGSLKLDGNTVSTPVKLQANTVYQLIVLQAYGMAQPPMKEPFKVAFTTGTVLGTGVVAGKLLPPPNINFDQLGATGFVGLLPSNQDLKRLTPADLPKVSIASDQTKGGNYRVRGVPVGSYILVAVVYLPQVQNQGQTSSGGTNRLEENVTELAQTSQPQVQPTVMMGFYDKDKNGQPDSIQVKAGDSPLENIDIQTAGQAIIKQAPRSITVTATSPKDGDTNVRLDSLSVSFSEPLAAGGRFVPVEVNLLPTPDGFNNKPKIQNNGQTAVYPVKLAQNATYKFVVNYALAASGAELTSPVTVTFSTGAVQVKPGSVTGKVELSDKSTPVGEVKLIDADATSGTAAAKQVQVRATGDIARTGDYLVASVVPGRSFLAFAEVDLGDAGIVQVFYDANGDGKADVLTAKEGETVQNINFTVTVPEKQQAGTPVEHPNQGATAGLDLNPAKGNQGLTTVAGVGTNARVDVAVYVKGVKDLTGFTVQVSFDSGAVAFDSLEPYTTKEGTNILESSGGRALYLPAKSLGTSVEYAGTLLGAQTSSTAPDGDGLIVVLHFVTTRTFTSETTIEIPQVVIKGIDSKGKAATDSISSDASVTLIPLTATTQKVDLSILPEEVEGKVSFDLVDKTGKSLGRKLEQVAAGDSLTVNILAKEGATGITGFTARLEFNPSQLEYVDKSFTAGSMMPGLTALAKSGTGYVEVGGAAIAAFGGSPSTTASGVLGTVRFVVPSDFSGSAFIALTNANYQFGSAREEFDLYTLIILGKYEVLAPPPDSGGSLTPKAGDGSAMLDLDTASGDQKSQTVYNVKGGQKVDVQVLLGKEYANAAGFQVVLKFDPDKVSVVGWKKDGTSFASAIDLPAQSKADSVTYGASILGGTTTARVGALAVLTFETASNFTGDTEITLATVAIRVSGVFNAVAPGASVVLSSGSASGPGAGPKKPTPDFDGDGEVGFSDFFAFAGAFGQPATGANKAYDLDEDGEVGFGDFFAFAGAFGTKVSSKPSFLAKPAGLGAVGSNGKAQLTLKALPSDRQDLMTVEVGVAGATQVQGYGLNLSYDPSQLELIASQPQGAFEAGAEGRPLLRSSDGLGAVHLADAVVGEGVSGDGSLMRLTFRVRPGGGLGSLRVVDGLLLDAAGLTNPMAGAGLDGILAPLSYGVSQNYPNPFNPVTQIAYQVPDAGRVRLIVYNILGQQVRTLVNGQVAAGFYRAAWDGKDDLGRTVSSGIYLYRMDAGKFSQVHKMMLLK